MFSDQDDVDNYVDNYPHTGKATNQVWWLIISAFVYT